MKSITKIINDVSLVEKICGLKNVILAKVHNFFTAGIWFFLVLQT